MFPFTSDSITHHSGQGLGREAARWGLQFQDGSFSAHRCERDTPWDKGELAADVRQLQKKALLFIIDEDAALKNLNY